MRIPCTRVRVGKLVPTGALKRFFSFHFISAMSAWCDMCVPKSILMALNESSFFEPTAIQRLVVPCAIKQRMNIIGAAQTGSGKTLAFGLPILARLNADENMADDGGAQPSPVALVLTPTRELAIQIKQHLQSCAKYQKTKVSRVLSSTRS
jgi:ATP-dependent RNA helicase DDX24/MAK5